MGISIDFTEKTTYAKAFKDGRVDGSLVQNISVWKSAEEGEIEVGGDGSKYVDNLEIGGEAPIPTYSSDLVYPGSDLEAILANKGVGTTCRFLSFAFSGGGGCGCSVGMVARSLAFDG
jgi:hypothetical protein